MRTSWKSTEPKGIEDYLKDLCLIYRGEIDNPHDVNASMDDERAIQILKYNLWDVERSILEMPATWRYLYLEEKGSLPTDDESIARKIYDYAPLAEQQPMLGGYRLAYVLNTIFSGK